MDVFTSSTIERILDAIRSLGYLEASAGGLAALAYGVGYLLLRNELFSGDVGPRRALGALGPRVALGAIFFVMGGLNGFFQFVPEHPSSLREPCAACQSFLQGIVSTGYLFYVIKGTELVVGALLILGFWVPLAALLLAPITLNIVMYHLFLNPGGLPIAVLVTGLHGVVLWQQRRVFLPLLQMRSQDPKIGAAGLSPADPRGAAPDPTRP